MVNKKYLDYDLTSFSMQSNDATHQGQDMVTLLSCAKCCISKTHWKKHVLVSVQLPLRLHYAYLPLDVNEVRCFSVVIFSEFVRCQNVSRRVFLYLAVTKKYYYCWWLSKSCTSRENHHFPLSVCALSEMIRRQPVFYRSSRFGIGRASINCPSPVTLRGTRVLVHSSTRFTLRVDQGTRHWKYEVQTL